MFFNHYEPNQESGVRMLWGITSQFFLVPSEKKYLQVCQVMNYGKKIVSEVLIDTYSN